MRYFFLCLVFLGLYSCKSEFSGTEFGSGYPVKAPRSEDLNRLEQGGSGDDQALAKCLRKWGKTPFDSADFSNYRKIDASVSVLGFGNPVNDTQVTNEPKLILVSAAVNVGGNPTYKLLNPNGWYCFKVGVSVNTNLKIDLHCKANLADNEVGVGVGSSGSQNSVVGVHVGAKVTVNRVGC